MNSLVAHLTKISPTSTVASCRIAKLLAEELGCEIMHRYDEDKVKAYDVVFVVNSPSAFCEYIDQLVEICRLSDRLIWVMNDYTIYPPTQLRNMLYEADRKLEMWGTLPKLPYAYHGRKTYGNLPRDADHVLNWNALSYSPVPEVCPPSLRPNPGVVYWGAFREYRLNGFNRYFWNVKRDTLPITVSTSLKASDKFARHYPNIGLLGPLVPNLTEQLSLWPATILIEDTMSHSVFCQPPNRFYEALSAGLAIFVDWEASLTLKTAGYEVDPGFVVRSYDDLQARWPNVDVIREIQRRLWTTYDPREELISKLRQILAKEKLL